MQISTHLSLCWLLLKDLSSNEKLSLIELLVKSLQSTNPTPAPKKGRRDIAEKSDWVQNFSGSWNDFPEPAEEMIAMIENARTASRSVEML